MKIKRLMIIAMLLAFSMPAKASEMDLNLYEDICEEIAGDYGCCPELIESMIYFESSGNPKAKSSCGAIGLMQIRPELHQDRIERLGITDLTDPYQNILAGTDYLMELAEDYEPCEALVAYNCGAYSKELKKVQDGQKNKYAEKILNYAEELERAHGK